MFSSKSDHWVWLRNAHFDVGLISCPIFLQVLILLLINYHVLSPLMIFAIYSVIFDAPHIAATHAKIMVSMRGAPWRSSLWRRSCALYLTGPAVLGIGAFFKIAIAFKLLYGMVLAWAAFHSVRQHYGVYVAYQLRLGEHRTGIENRISYWLFHIALLNSGTYYLLSGPLPRWIFSGDPISWIRSPEALYTTVGLLVALLTYETIGLVKHGGRSFPRFLLVAGLTIFPGVFYLSGMLSTLSPLLITPLFTVHHSVQYMAFTFHSIRSTAQSAGEGLVTSMTTSPYRYLGFILLVGISIRGFEWVTTQVNPLLAAQLASAMVTGSVSSEAVILAATMGYSLQHYVLDQHIWRKNELVIKP